MSYILEMLGRGLISHLSGAFMDSLGMRDAHDIDELRDAIKDDPEDLALQVRLGGQFLRTDDPLEAREVFIRILAKDRDHLVARLGLACAFDELGQIEIALEQLRIAQKVDPANPAILFCLGYCHERLGHEDQAVDYYQDSLNICPTLRNAHERLAAIGLKNDDVDLAIHHYASLCELDPHQADLHLTLANLFVRAGDYENAIERYEHALTLEPENWTAHQDTVTAYEEAGLIREAIEHLHKMIDNQADFPETRLRLGDLYARIGDDVSAVSQYEKALEQSPDYLEAHVKLATQHLRAARFSDAAQSFSSALEINDRLLSAYVGIGVAQMAGGQNEEADASFDMARSIEPNSTLLFSEVARMQLKADAAEQSEKFLTKLSPDAASDATPAQLDLVSRQIDRLRETIRQTPNHADLYYRLGLLLKNRGQIDESIASLEKAVEINPCYSKALIKLGLAYKDVGRSEDAANVFRSALDITPDYLDLHYQLGLLFAQRHQFQMAVEHFESAVQGNPANVEFQANLALALQNLGLVDRANASWQIVCNLAPESGYAAQARVAMAKQRESD